MSDVEQWWRVRKPDGRSTWVESDPTEWIATGKAPAWEGSIVDGPYALAADHEGAVEAATRVVAAWDAYLRDEDDEMDSAAWAELRDSIDALRTLEVQS